MISLGVHDNYKVFNSSWASGCQAPLARTRSDCLKVPSRVGPSQNNLHRDGLLKRIEGAERCLRLCTEGLLRSPLLVLLSVLVKDGAYYLPRNYIESSLYMCCLIPLPRCPRVQTFHLMMRGPTASGFLSVGAGSGHVICLPPKTAGSWLNIVLKSYNAKVTGNMRLYLYSLVLEWKRIEGFEKPATGNSLMYDHKSFPWDLH